MNTYPLIMEPCYRSGSKTPWGGSMLADAFMKNAPQQCGESLEVSVLEGEESIVREGSCAGRTLTAMVSLLGSALTGTEDASFPISVKMIDAETAPKEAAVSESTAVWMILNCDQDAAIELAGAQVPVKPGHVWRIPAGVSRRPGPAMQILEAVWTGRPAASAGAPATVFGTTALCKGGSRTYYVSDGELEVCRVNVFGKMPLDDARMLILMPLAPCLLTCGEETMQLMPCETVIIPAALEGCCLVSDDCKVIMISASDRDALRAELGYRSENVVGLAD